MGPAPGPIPGPCAIATPAISTAPIANPTLPAIEFFIPPRPFRLSYSVLLCSVVVFDYLNLPPDLATGFVIWIRLRRSIEPGVPSHSALRAIHLCLRWQERRLLAGPGLQP